MVEFVTVDAHFRAIVKKNGYEAVIKVIKGSSLSCMQYCVTLDVILFCVRRSCGGRDYSRESGRDRV
jgi:hypothetical protein